MKTCSRGETTRTVLRFRTSPQSGTTCLAKTPFGRDGTGFGGAGILGNWSSTTTDGTTQDRTHDESNEITSIGGASTTVDYDAAGNMTRIPVPGAETTAYYLCTYDAWNRLTGVFHDDGNTAGQLDSADTLVAAYRYDPPSPSLRSGFGGARGLNRRIAKIIPLYADSQNPTTPTGYDRTDYLFVSVRRSTPWVGDAIGARIAWGA